MKKVQNRFTKIVAAAAVTIFSLTVSFVGVYAWFLASMTATESGMQMRVKTKNVEIESINLYKFDYHSSLVGDIEIFDYLTPETGAVNKYGYSEDTEEFDTVYDAAHDEWDDVSPITVMNVYDPVAMLISSQSLKDMNCNAIYEVTFTSSELVNALLDLQSIRLTAKSKASNEIFLTDCVDFDVFYESDLADSNPLYTDGVDSKLYYPSYIDKATPLSESEEVYYKLSYLSNLISEDPLQSHSNFYSSNPKPGDIDLATDESVTFTSESLTIYINVNYAPAELEQYLQDIYSRNILAVYDFYFSFSFSEGAGA